MKEEEIRKISVDIPTKFEHQNDYLRKLFELIQTEGKVAKLQQESYCEGDVVYRFTEVQKIVCWLELDLPPNTNLKEFREGVLLSIAIRRKSEGELPYSALGRIKSIKHIPDSPMKKGIVQIDIGNPLKKSDGQKIPDKQLIETLSDELSFRVKFDDQNIRNQLKLIN